MTPAEWREYYLEKPVHWMVRFVTTLLFPTGLKKSM